MIRLSGVLAVRPAQSFWSSSRITRTRPPVCSTGTPSDRLPCLRSAIEVADHRPGVAAQVVGAGLELVQLLDHVERDDHLVVREQEDRVGVVQQDVGVEHEGLHAGVASRARRARRGWSVPSSRRKPASVGRGRLSGRGGVGNAGRWNGCIARHVVELNHTIKLMSRTNSVDRCPSTRSVPDRPGRRGAGQSRSRRSDTLCTRAASGTHRENSRRHGRSDSYPDRAAGPDAIRRTTSDEAAIELYVALPLEIRPRVCGKDLGRAEDRIRPRQAVAAGQAIGESWELYDFPPGVVDGSADWVSSPIANGPLAGRTLHQAVTEFGPDLHGDVPLVGQGHQGDAPTSSPS